MTTQNILHLFPDEFRGIFQIVSKLGRRIKTITADNLSREDRELLIEAVNKFSEDPNIHLYIKLLHIVQTKTA